MSFTPGRLKQPINCRRYLRGVRGVQAFPLAILPAGPAQVPVLSMNCTVQVQEDRPCQYGTQVLPVPKEQGEQVRVLVHPHPRAPPCC